jgi:hypothetical protein
MKCNSKPTFNSLKSNEENSVRVLNVPKERISGAEINRPVAFLSSVIDDRKCRKKKQKKPRDRGTLLDFFDNEVKDRVYNSYEVQLDQPQTDLLRNFYNERPRTRLTAKMSNGHLQIDEAMLKQEVQQESRKRWLFESTNKAIPERFARTVQLFDDSDYSFSKVREPLVSKMKNHRLDDEDDGEVGAAVTSKSNQRNLRPVSAPAARFNFQNYEKPVLSNTLSKSISHDDNNGFFSNSNNISPKNRGIASAEGIDFNRSLTESHILSNIDSYFHRNSDILLFLDCLKMNILPTLKSGGLHVMNEDLMKDIHEIHEELDKTLKPSYSNGRKKRDLLLIENHFPASNLLLVKIPPVLLKNNYIVSLDLTNHSIGNDKGIILSDLFAYCPSLEIIKLSNNRFTDSCLFRIIKAIFQHTVCRYLDISYNVVEKSTALLLCEQLIGSSCHLEYLNLNHCDLTDEYSSLIIESLIDNKRLEVLLLKAAGIGADESRYVNKWMNFFENNIALVELCLSENYIKKQFFRKIFHSLITSSQSKIKKVDFSYNQISDHDALVASPGLEGNKVLEFLNFSHNLIESKGALALIVYSSLKDGRLQEVNLLGNNQICETVFYYSIQAMKKVVNYCELAKDEIMNEMRKLGESESSQAIQEKFSPLRKSCLFLLQPDKTIPSSSALMVHITKQVNRPKKQEIVVEDVKKGSKKPKEKVASVDVVEENNLSRRPLSFAFDPLNLHGNYDLSLDDPYHHLIAKMIFESIHYHPFSSFREIKWFNPRMKVYEYFSFYRKNTSVSLPFTSNQKKTNSKDVNQTKKSSDPFSYEEEDDEAVEEEKRKEVELNKKIQSPVITLPYFNKNQNLFILVEKVVSKMISINQNETIDNYLTTEKTKKFRMSFEKEGYIGENEKKILDKTEKERKEKLLLEIKSLLLIVMNEKFQFHVSLEIIDDLLVTWNNCNISVTDMRMFLSSPFSFLTKLLSILFEFCLKEIKKKDSLSLYEEQLDYRSMISKITMNEFKSFFIRFLDQRPDTREEKECDGGDDLQKYFSEITIDHPFFIKAILKRNQHKQDSEDAERTSLFDIYSMNSVQFLQKHLTSSLHNCLTITNLQNTELSSLNDFYNPYLVLGLNQPYSLPFEGKLSCFVDIPFSCVSMIPYNRFARNSFHFFVESFLSSSLSSAVDTVSQNKYQYFNDFLFRILENYENYLFLSYSQAEEILKILLISQTNIKYFSAMTLIEKLMFQMYSFRDFRQFLIRNLYFNQVRFLLF